MLENFSYYGSYRTRTFGEIYDDYNEFIVDFNTLFPNVMKHNELVNLYYLLCAKFMNSHIANSSENQFKFKLASIIFEYGPTWAKRLEVQDKIRNFSEEDLIAGGRAIYNHAYNPSTAPSTQTTEELLTIDDQNTTGYKKSKLEAYGMLWSLLVSDVTEAFLKKFKVLFIQIAQPDYPLFYVNDEEQED